MCGCLIPVNIYQIIYQPDLSSSEIYYEISSVKAVTLGVMPLVNVKSNNQVQ